MSELSLKTHYSVAELLSFKLSTLPSAHKNVLEKAKRENWIAQKRKSKGGGLEYELISMPEAVQKEILLKTAPQQTAVALQEIEQNRPLASNELWQMWDAATNYAQEQAKIKLGTMFAVANLVESGVNVLTAFEMVCGKENAERQKNGEQAKMLSVGSLKNWWYRIKDEPRQDWLPLLLNNSGKTSKNVAEMSEEAWRFFKKFYYCREKPTISHSYEVLKETAALHGWAVPSLSSLKRRMAREVPKMEEVYRRGGEYELSRLYPSQVRTVASLQAMEWINGDGYQHNVWVRFPDGEVKRPKSWLWQDVRTRRVLAARCDKSENTDTIRLSLLDVISRYGLGALQNGLGICLVGGVGEGKDKSHARFTTAQWHALELLLRQLEANHPRAKVYGHRDLSPDIDGDGSITPKEWVKTCPNFDVWEWLDRGETVFVEHLFKE